MWAQLVKRVTNKVAVESNVKLFRFPRSSDSPSSDSQQTYSYGLSVPAGTATIASTSTTSSSGTNTTTLTLNSTASVSTAVTVTGKVLDGTGSATSASITTLAPYTFLVNNAVTGWANGTDVSGTSVYNGISYQVYAFQPSIAPGAASKVYCLSYNSVAASNMYVLAVGGGGQGGNDGGGGGGAGGVVMNSVSLPSTSGVTQNIIINVGAGGIGAGADVQGIPGTNTTVNFSAVPSSNIIALGGCGGGSYGATVTNTSYASAGGNSNNRLSATACVNNYNNYANYGGGGGTGESTSNSGGGGGAGTPGVTTGGVNTAPNGGNGIQCFLPGISTFAPNGTAYGSYYWGGGGGGKQYKHELYIGSRRFGRWWRRK